jgi:hypothetical protein
MMQQDSNGLGTSPAITVATMEGTTTTAQQQPSSSSSTDVFSSNDVDLLVRLVLAGEWTHVEFYFNFLISHYQRYNDISYQARTSNIIHSLYELMVNVKVQKYFEALERYVPLCDLSSVQSPLTFTYYSDDTNTVTQLITVDLPLLSNFVHPHLYSQLRIFARDRNAFRNYKQTILRLEENASCVKFRNLVANDVRASLDNLITMYSKDDRHHHPDTSQHTPEVYSNSNVSGSKRKYGVIDEQPDNSDTTAVTASGTSTSESEDPWKKRRLNEDPSKMDVLLQAFDIVNSPENPPTLSQTSPKAPVSERRNSTSSSKPPVKRRKSISSSTSTNIGSSKKSKVDPDLEKRVTDSLDFKGINSQKSIKPTVKLCTGGITSTPALRERMFKVLEQFDTPCTWESIQSRVSGNRAKVWATLCMLVNAGVVIQTGKGRRGHPYKYMLSPELTIERLPQLESKFRTLDYEAQKIHKQYKQEMQKQQMQDQIAQQKQQQQQQQQQAEQNAKKQEPVRKLARPAILPLTTVPTQPLSVVQLNSSVSPHRPINSGFVFPPLSVPSVPPVPSDSKSPPNAIAAPSIMPQQHQQPPATAGAT